MTRGKNAGKKGKQNKNQTETRTQQPKTSEEILSELVARIKENATSQDKFIQLSSDLKKVGPGLSLTGLERVYKQPEKSDFVYSLEHRVAGPTSAMDKVLGLLGSSMAGQRLKNDIVDLTNYQSHLVVRPPVQRELLPEKHFSSSDISDLARRIKETKNAVKEEKANASPRKKRAQRRKSNTGVKVARTPRVSVDRLLATSANLSEVLQKLSERQQGLDLSLVTFEDSTEGLLALGARPFRIRHKSKRPVLQYSGGHLTTETTEQLETVLRKVGVPEADLKTLVESHRNQLQQLSQSEAPKNNQVKEQPKEKPKAKELVKEEPKEKQAKTSKKVQPKVNEKQGKKPSKTSKKQAEPRNSPKVTKAKTRAVKPRTSHE
jgi:hypothetical protein